MDGGGLNIESSLYFTLAVINTFFSTTMLVLRASSVYFSPPAVREGMGPCSPPGREHPAAQLDSRLADTPAHQPGSQPFRSAVLRSRKSSWTKRQPDIYGFFLGQRQWRMDCGDTAGLLGYTDADLWGAQGVLEHWHVPLLCAADGA